MKVITFSSRPQRACFHVVNGKRTAVVNRKLRKYADESSCHAGHTMRFCRRLPSTVLLRKVPNNIGQTVERKRIFCCISFLLLLEFCKSFTSSNLRWRLRCGAIFVTAYRCTDYCANPELSSTLARRLN